VKKSSTPTNSTLPPMLKRKSIVYISLEKKETAKLKQNMTTNVLRSNNKGTKTLTYKIKLSKRFTLVVWKHYKKFA
jgi:hypothetical protein